MINESEGFKWWADEPLDTEQSEAASEDHWWNGDFSIANEVAADQPTSMSHIPSIGLSQYLLDTDVCVDDSFAVPVIEGDDLYQSVVAELERNKSSGKILDYQLFDGRAQDTQAWDEIKAGKDVTIIPPYLVLLTSVEE